VKSTILTPKQQGSDLAGFAEVHCDGYGDPERFANDVNPDGRSWYTYWLAVATGPKLNDVPMQATAYASGRVLRLDMRIAGRNRSYKSACLSSAT
jgi:hypothetical protein